MRRSYKVRNKQLISKSILQDKSHECTKCGYFGPCMETTRNVHICCCIPKQKSQSQCIFCDSCRKHKQKLTFSKLTPSTPELPPKWVSLALVTTLNFLKFKVTPQNFITYST